MVLMLINMTVQNWMSFYNKTSLNMIASSERQHGERIPRINKYPVKVLPVTAIYGGNAAGKTNFFRALAFTQDFIVNGIKPEGFLKITPFLLDSDKSKEPSHFSFEILVDELIYELSFTVTRSQVLEEQLIEINSTQEKILYHRHNGKIKFYDELNANEFLKFAFQGTRDNQLFLNNAISQKATIKPFQRVFNWFKDTLTLIAPDSRFGQFERFWDEKSPQHQRMNKTLMDLDTGIAKLTTKKIPLEHCQFPEKLKSMLEEEVTPGKSVYITHGNNYLLISRKDGNSELSVKKMMTYHSGINGNEIAFELDQESDGTRRLIHLVPAFLDLCSGTSKKVYIIDELDRSLHTLALQKLLRDYLAHCSNESRAQLIFTTHDLLLMDQKLLRRDEMWATERNKAGISGLFPFSDFKEIRYDKDIRKSYLQGRLGGVPHMPIKNNSHINHHNQRH